MERIKGIPFPFIFSFKDQSMILPSALIVMLHSVDLLYLMRTSKFLQSLEKPVRFLLEEGGNDQRRVYSFILIRLGSDSSQHLLSLINEVCLVEDQKSIDQNVVKV